MERRVLMAASPLGPGFQQQSQSSLERYDFPQGSITAIQIGHVFTYGATNPSYRDVNELQRIVSAAGHSPPIASDDSATTPSNMPVTIDVLANDSDPNSGGTLNPASVTIVTQPSNGTVSVDAGSGAVTYVPSGIFVGMDQFTYTVSDNLGQTSNAATVTITVAPAITATGTNFSVFPGLPLNSTNAVVATFTDTNPAISISQLTAMINWGDGLMSSGIVSKPDPSGVYTVTSTFTYPLAFAASYVPGTALPASITISDTGIVPNLVATANSSAVLLSTGSGIPFSGRLALVAGNGPDASNGYTTTDQPTFSGTAPPFSIVQLDTLASGNTTLSLGQAIATASGQWSVSAGSILVEGNNTVTATVTIPGLFQSGTMNLPAVFVDTVPPQLATNFPMFTSKGAVYVEFNDSSGMNPSNLLRRGNYTLFGRGLSAFHPKRVTLITVDNPAEVELIIKMRPRERSRIKTLKISGTNYVLGSSSTTGNVGITDNAGNSFQDAFPVPIGPDKESPAKSDVIKFAPTKHHSF